MRGFVWSGGAETRAEVAEDPSPMTRTAALLGALLLMCTVPEPIEAATAPPASERPAPLRDAVGFDTPALKFQISPDDGRYEITDLAGGVTWRSNPYKARFGAVTLNVGGKKQTLDLAKCEIKPGDKAVELTFHPLADKPAETVRVTVRAVPDGKTLAFAYEAAPSLQIDNVRVLDEALATTGAEKGHVLIPAREGLLIPADSGVGFNHTFGTYVYEGCHMAMAGVVKAGAAVLLNWDDPYVTAYVQSALPKAGDPPGAQVLSFSLSLSKSAKAFTVTFLGKGDLVTIAKAYRPLAKEKGWLVTWDEKLKGNPNRAKLFGAANVKLWSCLHRKMNEDSSKEIESRVNWTFDEAAQVAEHIKNDLKLDRVHFILGGWIKRGYDNQHPDILPAAPECGGDEGLAQCAKRVRALGYLLDLHDNYQDMYRDSPSWNEDFIMKTRDGKLAKGGHWAGGVAYLTCSQKAVELAKRPQNLTAVKKLTNADSYFIDTTYAAGLCECFDPKHPLTRRDDMKWKQAISDYAREVFGMFGSECGREWAVPHADYFEGLTGVSGGYYHDAGLLQKLGAVSVPLFELVYRDCLQLYGKYGYDVSNAAGYVLHHISIGRPLNYHVMPAHLYWKQPEAESLAVEPAVAEVTQTGPRKFSISYRWKVEKTPAAEWTIFVHFTDPKGQIKFQGDYKPTPPTSQWQPGDVNAGPFTVNVPDGLSGAFDIRIGMFQQVADRARLRGTCDKERRVLAGKIKVAGDKIEFAPPETAAPGAAAADPALFVRADNGWADGLHTVDRFLKNTHEVLGPLNELTSRMQMTAHQFLTDDRRVRRSLFGDGDAAVEVVVNGGAETFRCMTNRWGDVVLPPGGFLVQSPAFVAFCALRFNGVNYSTPSLFTLRSLDGKPIADSSQVRVFHAFGGTRVKVAKAELEVPKEAVVPGK
jgi:hypothetical protein